MNDVEKFGLASGIGYNISDALTINGQPGLLYNCSQQGKAFHLNKSIIVLISKRKINYSTGWIEVTFINNK
mgnify:CR=1 FL=1